MRRAKLDQIRQDMDALAEQLAAELARPEAVIARPELVGLTEVAVLAGISANTAAAWRKRGRLPQPYVALACGPVWLKSEIEDWIAEREHFRRVERELVPAGRSGHPTAFGRGLGAALRAID